MMSSHTNTTPVVLALLVGLAMAACSSPREESGPAPVDRGVQTGTVDTTATGVGPDTSIATPPINPAPSPTERDSAPQGGAQAPPPSDEPAQGKGAELNKLEYEGWRQYSVNCARCHGQDALPNPVAANLLISLARGGPMDSYDEFGPVVTEGRPDRGMPAFKGVVSPEQTRAMYAYLKGRAEKRIPPGRPEPPGA